MNGYTLVPTDETGMLAEAWTEREIDEAEIIEYCRSEGYDGAVVYAGMNLDSPALIGPEGYEDNYCGWIDAR